MANGECSIEFPTQENAREDQFRTVWSSELDDVFTDVAGYYDVANHVASLGLWTWFLKRFLATMEVRSGQKVLDVCAGTNAVGLGLLEKVPALDITAIDRSEAMQDVGRKTAGKKGHHIESVISDVHELPFPDEHFDVVTLQWASRHLRLTDVFGEIKRVLKPGGHFYHCDMLRPKNRIVAALYYGYLRICLSAVAAIFRSGPTALNCREYFLNALRMFYSAEELTKVLEELGYEQVYARTLFAGMIGFHKAVKN